MVRHWRKVLAVRKSQCPRYAVDCWWWRGRVLPVVVMALRLDVAPLMTRFRGAIVDLEETF